MSSEASEHIDDVKSAAQTREEIEQKRQVCLDGFLRCSLKLIQMDFKVKFDRVEAEKCKVAEQKEKMLKKIVEEQTFLNTAIKAAESSEFTSISGLQ